MQVEYVYNSNAIEGNTLTLRETQLILEEGITISNKPLRDVLEARNHPEALKYVEDVAKSGQLKEEHLLNLHQIIMKGVVEDAGTYRRGEVQITGAKFIPPPSYEVPFKIRELVAEYNRNPDELVPIELAAWTHHQLAHIHPFTDGNGRVARLLSNLILLRYGYPMAVILRVDRKKYLDSLTEADAGDLAPFANFLAANVEQSLDTYLRAMNPKQDPLLPISEVCKGTRFSPEYVSLLARTRRLPALKIGRKWMISKSTLREYMKEVG
jgi:excisionase family DNA binding protein